MEELVEKSKKGDNQAFSELIISMENELYKIARTRLRNEEDINKDEISEMNSWLFRVDREIDSGCYTYHEYASEVVYEYIKQWLIEQINENILIGTQELFEIYSAI